jgi:CBS domain-containing protein
MKVAAILQKKTKPLVTITSDITVYEALKIMGEHNIGALMIVEDNQLNGIISERDYARKIALKGKNSHDTLVKEIMTSELVTITPIDTIEECMQLMGNYHIRHLPVLEGGQLIGIISIGDVVNSVIEMQKNTIDHLQNYIRNVG